MKKMLILFLCMVTVAFSATATSIKWGLVEGQTLADITSGTIYLVYGTAPSASVLSGKESYSTADIVGTVAANGVVSGGFYYNGDGVSIEPSTIGETANKNYSFYAIAISDDGKTLSVGTSKSVRIATGSLSNTLAWQSGNFTTFTAVPEPCSVALLMLGIAAFGLKRRV